MSKKILLTMALSIAAVLPFASHAQVNINVDLGAVLGVAPPAPLVEVIPAPRPGFVWVNGFWDWNGRQHVWAPGHWEQQRVGYVYVTPEWHHEGQGWVLRRGGWEEHEHNRHEDEYRHHEHEHEREHGFCPPGQAKKGRC